MKHIYQMALRRADISKKVFRIERDLILCEKKLTSKDIEDISKENECDINVTYLGQLTHQPKKEEVLNAVYHTEQDIKKFVKEWHREEKTNGKSI